MKTSIGSWGRAASVNCSLEGDEEGKANFHSYLKLFAGPA